MRIEKDLYVPKGGMCAVCQHQQDDCSHLNFEEMPVISIDASPQGTVLTVRCKIFAKPDVKEDN